MIPLVYKTPTRIFRGDFDFGPEIKKIDKTPPQSAVGAFPT